MHKDFIREVEVELWPHLFEPEPPKPPRPKEKIILTHHASKRLAERFGNKPAKNEKITYKAWHSAETIPKKFNHFLKYDCVYRFYLGFLFCFRVNWDSKILVTVLGNFIN